jgi:hypothetical protein
MIKWVIKRDGRTEIFSKEKLLKSLLCCLDAQNATMLIDQIINEMPETIRTEELFFKVRSEMWKKFPEAAVKFGLREDMMKLGPAGYNFEDFYAKILSDVGVKNVKVRQTYSGKCALHELDIVYTGKNGKEFVEMKYHNQFGIYTGLKEALYTYMRFIDLNDADNDFTKANLVTNTKISEEAIKFSNCKNMGVVAWKYPPNNGLETLIERTGSYPVTSLINLLDEDMIKQLMNLKIITLKDFVVAYSTNAISKKYEEAYKIAVRLLTKL